MKKRAFAVLTALAVTLLGTTTVFADSPTAETATVAEGTTVTQTGDAESYAAETTASEGYEVVETSDNVVTQAAVQAQNLIANQAAADNAGSTVTVAVLSTVDVSPNGATKDSEGYYNVTLNLASIVEGEDILILHWNDTTNGWEVIEPTSVGTGTVTFRTASLSPISVVRVTISNATAASGAATSAAIAALSAHDANEQAALRAQAAQNEYLASLAANPFAALGLIAAPKTGEAVPFAMIVLIAGIGAAAFCGKKYLA